MRRETQALTTTSIRRRRSTLKPIGIFGPDYSSSDNDATKHDDDDIESSAHDDQQEEEAQALTADDQEEAHSLLTRPDRGRLGDERNA